MTLFVLSGCGGETPPSPERVVARYLEASNKGDGETACAALAESARRELLSAASRYGTLRRATCPQLVSALRTPSAPSPPRSTRSRVHGDRASVYFASRDVLNGRGPGSFELVRDGGKWRIATVRLQDGETAIERGEISPDREAAIRVADSTCRKTRRDLDALGDSPPDTRVDALRAYRRRYAAVARRGIDRLTVVRTPAEDREFFNRFVASLQLSERFFDEVVDAIANGDPARPSRPWIASTVRSCSAGTPPTVTDLASVANQKAASAEAETASDRWCHSLPPHG